MKHIKRSYFVNIVFFFLFAPTSFSLSFDSNNCGTISTISSGVSVTNYGGRYITSQGTITSFVLIARFSDDNETSLSWPIASLLPDWAQNILAPSYNSSGAYIVNSFTSYIYENSYGKLHIIGDVYYVTLPQTENYYYSYSNNPDPSTRSDIIRTKIEDDAFAQFALLVSSLGINMAKYDNWKMSSAFTHIYTGPGSGQTKDNTVDMSWFILRNMHDELYSTRLFIDIALLYTSKIINGITIASGFPGSGISMFHDEWVDNLPRNTMVNMKISPYDGDGYYQEILPIMAHELSHYFFGYNHFGTAYLGQSFSSNRYSSIMTPYCINAVGESFLGYEKIRLGWITNSEICTTLANIDGKVLYDIANANNSITKIIKISIPGTTQNIFIENRSWVGLYEPRKIFISFGKTFVPAVIAYLIPFEDDYLSSTSVSFICANGKWNWNIIAGGSTGTSSDVDDVIVKTTPDPASGYNEKEAIFISSQPNKNWLALYNPNNFGGPTGKWC